MRAFLKRPDLSRGRISLRAGGGGERRTVSSCSTILMARLRKAARIWRNPKARGIGERVLFVPDERLFTINPPAIFGRRAPVEIEIGAGKGEFIIERAAQFPERDFIAVELSATITRVLAVRCGRAGLDNLRVVRMDARTLVNLMLPDASVSAYHIYYPDPWPKERHVKHRLFKPTLVASLFRTAEPGAIAYVATDVRDYAAEIFPMMEAAGFIRAVQAAPGAIRTGFARKYVAAGKAVFRLRFASRAIQQVPESLGYRHHAPNRGSGADCNAGTALFNLFVVSSMKRLLLILVAFALLPAAACSLRQKPSGEDYYAQGQLDFATKEYKAAIENYQQVIDKFPFSPYAEDAEMKIGLAYYQQKDYAETIGALDDFQRMHPTSKNLKPSLTTSG